MSRNAAPRARYVVAATPRTGSSLLCEGLSATGVAGCPDEFFAPDFRHLWLDRWDLVPNASFVEYFRSALRHGTTSNGVFGMKIQWMHVAVLAEDVSFRGDPEDVLDALFPDASFINIVREDRCGQALSWHRAELTGEWWRFEEDPPASQPARRLDTYAVRALEAEIDRQQAAWEAYFDHRGIEALTVVYEELENDYSNQVARALAFLGLDPELAAVLPRPCLVRQRDEVTVRWRQEMEIEVTA
jgi:trehalose 2-sulfotransferase